MELKDRQCEACRLGAPLLEGAELDMALSELPEWQLIEEQGIQQLMRCYPFDNYAKAYAFTCRVAELSEQQGHHPALLLEWGKVTVRWWTHKISGLHRNDAVMAAKTDALAEAH